MRASYWQAVLLYVRVLLCSVQGSRSLFPFRKQAMPFLTVDAIIGNQAFSIADVIVCSGLCCNKVISNFFKSS